jgi:serine phosphatase RsbU (regulator of sigma subunit)
MGTTPAGPATPTTLTGSAMFAPADLPALEVASYYLPVDVRGIGGDWLDVIALPGARVALVVGDVVGHGVAAAATMGRLRAAVHTLAAMDLPAEEVLTRLDGFVARLAEQEGRPDDLAGWIMSATCLYIVYDLATRRCTVARAGHPPPAIIDANGGVTFPDLPACTPIGLGMCSFESAEMELPEESVIAVYTDGLIESRETDIDSGLKRLSSALACTATVLHDYCSQVIDTMTTAITPRQDDIALLMARTRARRGGSGRAVRRNRRTAGRPLPVASTGR